MTKQEIIDYMYENHVQGDFKVEEMAEDLAHPQWIPCSERLPCNGIPVNITWVNMKPVSYYVDIKDKHFTATGIYYRGKWFWYSCLCEDLLYEYGNSKADAVDEDVEIVAWMPLPEPYKGDATDSQDESTPVYLSELYLCDPDKNTECKKTACYRNGGECIHTVHKEYRRVE